MKTKLFLFISLIGLLFFSCGQNSSIDNASLERTEFSMALQWTEGNQQSPNYAPSYAAPAGVNTIKITISGSGMSSITETFSASSDSAVFPLVPIGNDRIVYAEALAADNTILYKGYNYNVVFNANQTTNILVRMYKTITEIPMIFSVTSSGTNSIQINWSSVTKADSYQVIESSDSLFVSFNTLYQGTDTFYILTNHDTGTYYFKVRGLRNIATTNNISNAYNFDTIVYGNWSDDTNILISYNSNGQIIFEWEIENQKSVKKISAGADFTLMLTLDGDVWMWGGSYYAVFGIPGSNIYLPFKNSNLLEIVDISSGRDHTLILKENGTVWAAGNNQAGQLGDGSTTDRNTYTQVSYLTNIIAVSAGTQFSTALKQDGTVWTWGWNSGNLGDGTYTNRLTPVQVKGENGIDFLTNVIAISAGQYYILALKDDSTVWAWGSNPGTLGDGTTTNRPTPVRVINSDGIGFLTDVVAVSSGYSHSVALKDDGSVWTWGCNYYGQLGCGDTVERLTPVQVKDQDGENFLTNVVAISAGGDFTIALKDDGTVWSWGWNYFGQLGNGVFGGENPDFNDGIDRNLPTQVLNLTNIIYISAGNSHAVALKQNGTFWTWGRNRDGALGDGSSSVDESVPVPIQILFE